MTHIEKELIKQAVFKACEEDPAMVRQVIDAATHGVQSFADKQSDIATKFSFVLTQILDQYPDVHQFGPFSRLEILDLLKRTFDGTPWYTKEVERLSKKADEVATFCRVCGRPDEQGLSTICRACYLNINK